MFTVGRIMILVLGTLLVLNAGAAQETGPGQPVSPPAQPTALLVTATNAPLRVLGSDGQDHLEYDLIFTNYFTVPVSLEALEGLAPGGRVLLHLEGDALEAVTAPVLAGEATTEVPVSGAVATILDVVVAPGQPLARVSHRISYSLPDDAPLRSLIGSTVIEGPELAVDPRQALRIAPPLRGEGWLNVNGCCAANTPHRFIRVVVGGRQVRKIETFAIDWMRVQGGRLTAGDGIRNEDWYGYGAEVVSATAGTVVSIRTDMPEETPNQPTRAVQGPADFGGDHVTVQVAPGVYAFYAHLQPGSVTVRVGDVVTVGQPLGRLANTGSTTGPHLHFQLSSTPDVVTTESLPFTLDRYTLTSEFSAEDFTAAYAGRAAQPVTVPPHSQEGTYPLHLSVAAFPVGSSSAVVGQRDFAGLVDIGSGRHMYLECRGNGSPTVVLVAGLRAAADVWSMYSAGKGAQGVFSRVAEFTRVCAYDRPGTVVGQGPGRSDPVPQPVSAKDSVTDLHTLLSAADKTAPYVLVGHSYGGLLARLYAGTYPEDVSGLVLIDALSEFLQAGLTPAQRALWKPLRDPVTSADIAAYKGIERPDFDSSFAEVRAAAPLRPVPLAVLSADRLWGPQISFQIASGALPSDTPPDFGYVIDAAQKQAQAELAKLAPGATHIVNTNSGHDIHLEQPQLVINAVRLVVAAARKNTP